MIITNKKRIGLLILCLMLFSASYAESYQQLMQRANTAYQQQQYAEAVALYQQIADAGNEGSVLYYNLGNAYYKTDDLSHALLWYERALRLDPRNEDIKHNIAFVNRQLVDRIEVLPELFITRWWNALSKSLTSNTWAILSIIFCALMFLSVVLLLVARRPWLRSLGLATTVLCLLLTVFSIIFAHKEAVRYEKFPEAIVMQPVLNAKSTPNATGNDLFVIHEGLKVGVTDRLNDWLEIKLPNGEKGWVPAQGVEGI
ncbi:MAG: tetratricopeptide repeat protein [Bacteroidales bacterium]|nr:tetratricopeptide repeat protein [Bacteroidales bacterium]